jgi:hypothetical protein
MTTQEQAYIEGFVKRASEYGYSEDQAFHILKEATGASEELLKSSGLFGKKKITDKARTVIDDRGKLMQDIVDANKRIGKPATKAVYTGSVAERAGQAANTAARTVKGLFKKIAK